MSIMFTRIALGSIKKGNRHSEILMRDVEVLTFISAYVLHSYDGN